MKLQTCVNDWTCVAAAFAMAMDIPIGVLLDWYIGHQGDEVVFQSGYPRGIQPSECMLALISMDKTCTPLEVMPQYTNGKEILPVYPESDKLDRLDTIMKLMDGRQGVVTGRTAGGTGHALAWDGQYIFDPAGKGSVYPLAELAMIGFEIDCFWWITQIT